MSEPDGKMRFGASLQIFAIRTLCATLTWVLVVAFLPPPSGASAQSPLAGLLAMPVIVTGAAVFWGALAWIGSKGVPYVGLFALPMALTVVAGDPLLFILHAVTKSKWPEVVPVESLKFVNFAAFVVAVEPADAGNR